MLVPQNRPDLKVTLKISLLKFNSKTLSLLRIRYNFILILLKEDLDLFHNLFYRSQVSVQNLKIVWNQFNIKGLTFFRFFLSISIKKIGTNFHTVVGTSSEENMVISHTLFSSCPEISYIKYLVLKEEEAAFAGLNFEKKKYNFTSWIRYVSDTIELHRV